MGMRTLLSWSCLVSATLCAPSAWAAADAPPATSEAHKTEITILYDAFGKSPTMKKDWGFSALIEYGGKRILFDTGNNSDIFAQNVKAKGVDLTKLDFVIVSRDLDVYGITPAGTEEPLLMAGEWGFAVN